MVDVASMQPDMKSQRDRFVAFSFAAADLMFEVNPEGVITYATGAARELTGGDTKSLVGLPWLELFHGEDQRLLTSVLGRLADGARCGPLTVRLAVGQQRQAIFAAVRLPDHDDVMNCTLSAARVANMRLDRSYHRDIETGLPDRQAFEAAAAETMGAAQAIDQDLVMTLLELGDVAGFRNRAGDAEARRFMCQVAEFLRAFAVDSSATARLSDNRFSVIHMPDANTEQIYGGVSDLAQKADPEGRSLRVTGTSVDLNAGTLNRQEAGRALVYTINCFVRSDPAGFNLTSLNTAFKSVVEDTVGRVTALKSWVANHDFDLVFQPIVNLRTRETHHYEVLSRFGEGSPFEWITLAEGVGLIEEVDLTVCSRAINHLRTHEDRELRLAVNISGLSIQSQGFIDTLIGLAVDGEDVTKRLMFEITESAQIEDLECAAGFVSALRRSGFPVCLDDFGAGAASFRYLSALDIDFVKIDGAYVRRAQSCRRDATMLKAVTRMCNDLNVGTIAEMIETHEQHLTMRSLGVTYGQGFLFSRPVQQVRRVPDARMARHPARRAADAPPESRPADSNGVP